MSKESLIKSPCFRPALDIMQVNQYFECLLITSLKAAKQQRHSFEERKVIGMLAFDIYLLFFF